MTRLLPRPWFILAMVLLTACSDTTADRPASTLTPTTTAAATTSSAPTATTGDGKMTLPDDDRTLVVPTARPATIDGVIAAGEWDRAVTVPMSNDDMLLWMYSDDTLYVAVDGSDLGAVNLVFASAEEMWVLHSSAALGSSLYVPGDSVWEESHGYTWCCRDPNDDTARLGLLDREGWQANIGFTGDVGVVEYQVTMPWARAAVAVSSFTESNDPAYWPTDLSPEAREQLTGSRWSDPDFTLDEWWTIIPAG